jgi:hypothetical protein
MSNEPKIETPNGIGNLDKIFVSDLGFLMLRISFENGTFTTYNLGLHDSYNNIFTNKIMKYEEKEH